ncbi:lipid A-modifier LpxR family protein [Gemmatimonas sp.]|uniref:lipid A-modifier LpxR family protein n=1 Tax=Gemmatimonas sp. TaxID=1962908 RepID=UPI003F6ED544
MIPRVLIVMLSLLSIFPAVLVAQGAPVTWSLYVENDAFTDSDTGYTNGIRLGWTVSRNDRALRWIQRANPVSLLDALVGRPLHRAGIIASQVDDAPCLPLEQRRRRVRGACNLNNYGLAQTMYTPDSLADVNPQTLDRPYAGFLFANAGVTTVDAPNVRRPGNWIGYTEVSNQLILGVTGRAARAEDTQALAHWTWSTDAHRPLGWRNQLRRSVQVGFLTDLNVRPTAFERCGLLARRVCRGSVDDGRVLDFTPGAEVVTSTHLVRTSLGGVLRFGWNVPETVGMLRIPVSAAVGLTTPTKGERLRAWFNQWRPQWAYGFGTWHSRYVPYNMFIEGGLADGGSTGWRTIRQIVPRRTVHEAGYGVAVGNNSMNVRAQYAFRTNEYDPEGIQRVNAWHGFGNLTLSIHSR